MGNAIDVRESSRMLMDAWIQCAGALVIRCDMAIFASSAFSRFSRSGLMAGRTPTSASLGRFASKMTQFRHDHFFHCESNCATRAGYHEDDLALFESGQRPR